MRAWTLWRDQVGQDMIEFALVAGFLTVSIAAIVPGAAQGVVTVLSKVASVTTVAAAQPSSSQL
jgi:Flp pilus assembly pilin Flp